MKQFSIRLDEQMLHEIKWAMVPATSTADKIRTLLEWALEDHCRDKPHAKANS